MSALVALIVRLVLSLAATIGIAVASDSGTKMFEFIVYWIMIYAMISMYYHVRKMMREEDELEYRKRNGVGYRRVTPFEQEHPFFGLLLEYIILPVAYIIILFIAVPEGIARIFPETWRENVQMVLALAEILGVIIFDIWKVKEAYDTGDLEFNTDSIGGILRSLVKPICIFIILGFLAFGVIVFIDRESGNNKFSKKDTVSEDIREKFEKPDYAAETDESSIESEQAIVEETPGTSVSNDAYSEKVSDIESLIGSLGVMEIKVATNDVRYVETDEVSLTAIYKMEKKEAAVVSEDIPELYDEAVLVVGKYMNQLTGEEAYGYCVFFGPLIDEETFSFTWTSKYARLESTEEQISDIINNDSGYFFRKI